MAILTKSSVIFYDTQQKQAFAYISKFHFNNLNDISWSADGRFLMVTSDDGYCSFIVFDRNELGTPYTGSRLTLEELEPAPKPKVRKSAKAQATPTPGKENEAVSPAKKTKTKAAATEKPEAGPRQSNGKKVGETTTPQSQPSINQFFQRHTPTLNSPSVIKATPSATPTGSPHTATLPHKQGTPQASSSAPKVGEKVHRRVALFAAKPAAGSTTTPRRVSLLDPKSSAGSNSQHKPAMIDLNANSEGEDDCQIVGYLAPAVKKMKFDDEKSS